MSFPVLCPQDVTDSDVILNTTFHLERPESIYNEVWDLTTVPIFLILIIGPLINFKSVTFFTKFNSLGK
jgi:sodium-coupled neutral amino acid transporter 9